MNRFAYWVGIVAAFLAGCGGSQPSNGALGALPQRATLAPINGSSTYRLVYKFDGRTDGLYGINDLVNIGGTLYGATTEGGNSGCYNYGCGTIFALTPAGKKRIVYRFDFAHGAAPAGQLVHRGDEIYGTTVEGGNSQNCGGPGCGTVYAINTSGQERVLHSFNGRSDGMEPYGGVLFYGGKLYGTTFQGGYNLYGTIFVVDLRGHTRVLHAFGGGSDGDEPISALIALNGTLYGTTNQGGTQFGCYNSIQAGGCGTIYSITTSGSEHVLYRFKGASDGDGAVPLDGLTNVNGIFYGSTYYGGTVTTACPGGCGTVFEFNPATHRERIIYRFKGGSDGIQPVSGLVELRGALYGTTAFGGSGACSPFYSGCGTIYRLTNSGAETAVHSFSGSPSDGDRPWAGRLLVVNGTIYGATPYGGIDDQLFCTFPDYPGCGTIFAFTP